jgi:hypothetical protein
MWLYRFLPTKMMQDLPLLWLKSPLLVLSVFFLQIYAFNHNLHSLRSDSSRLGVCGLIICVRNLVTIAHVSENSWFSSQFI